MKHTSHTTTTYVLELSEDEFVSLSIALEEAINGRLAIAREIRQQGESEVLPPYAERTKSMIQLSDQFPRRSHSRAEVRT